MHCLRALPLQSQQLLALHSQSTDEPHSPVAGASSAPLPPAAATASASASAAAGATLPHGMSLPRVATHARSASALPATGGAGTAGSRGDGGAAGGDPVSPRRLEGLVDPLAIAAAGTTSNQVSRTCNTSSVRLQGLHGGCTPQTLCCSALHCVHLRAAGCLPTAGAQCSASGAAAVQRSCRSSGSGRAWLGGRVAAATGAAQPGMLPGARLWLALDSATQSLQCGRHGSAAETASLLTARVVCCANTTSRPRRSWCWRCRGARRGATRAQGGCARARSSTLTWQCWTCTEARQTRRHGALRHARMMTCKHAAVQCMCSPAVASAWQHC